MSIYDDRLVNAQINQKIGEIEQLLDNLDPDAASRAQKQVPGGPERLQAVLDYSTTVVGAAEPELVSQQQINLVAETLDHLGDHMHRFISNEFGWGEPDGIADTLLDQISRWPHSGGIPPGEVKAAASRFRRSAGQLLSKLEGETVKVAQQIEGMQANVDELTQKTDENRTEADAEIEALKAVIEEQKGRLDEAIRANQGQFSEAQERRSEKFNEDIAGIESRMNSLEAELKERLAQRQKETDEQFSETTVELADNLVQAEKIVGAIATTGTIGGFQREAKSQKKTADSFRIAAILAGLAAAALAIWGVIHAGQNGNSTEVAAKAFASFVFFGIAGYLATQSGKHREREERARRRELELAAFGPFINSLPDDKQDELVAKLAERIFGHEPPAGDGGNGISDEQVSLFGQIAGILRNVR